MDTLEKLESSVRKMTEAYLMLREEKEHLSGELILLGAELEQSRETIRNLRAELERYIDADSRYREFDTRKDELKEYIRAIIEKIDRYDDSDAIGTATDA